MGNFLIGIGACDPGDPFGDCPGDICDPIFDPTCLGVPSPPPVVVIPQAPGVSPSDLQNVADTLTNMIKGVIGFLGKMLGGLAALFNALKWLWDNVIKDAIAKIFKALQRIEGWLKKILQPILDAQRRMAAALRQLYNLVFRPIITIIQRVRSILHILEIFHVGFARRLDARLAQLETIILKPYLKLLAHTNSIGNWVSYILRADLLFHRALLLGSIKQNGKDTFNLVTAAPDLGYQAPPGFFQAPGPDPNVAFFTAVSEYNSTGAATVNDLITNAQDGASYSADLVKV